MKRIVTVQGSDTQLSDNSPTLSGSLFSAFDERPPNQAPALEHPLFLSLNSAYY